VASLLTSLRPAAQQARATAQPAADRPSADRLRAATELLSRGPTVVTSHEGHGAPLGTAAESAGAVSLTSALVLACIDEGSATLAAALESRRFALNVLTASMADVASRFSGEPGRELWERVGYTMVDDLPLLRDAAATLRCELHDIADGGPLTILVGRVVDC
jgi:3-hydroxy-9,10-secoandrosta-1,3,5(10)-triene-9,17-dione monooxygenase reductase component